jgi:transposase-like protein
MASIEIKCPHCNSNKIRKRGKSNGKLRYSCTNCQKTFYTQYAYNAWKPEVRKKVLAWTADGAGTRAIARQEKIHRDTVTSILKKQKLDKKHQ